MDATAGRDLADLTYNEDSGYWACCYDRETDVVDCENPSKEIYPAPAPSELVTIQFLPEYSAGTPTYTTMTATASASTSVSVPASATTTENPTSSTALHSPTSSKSIQSSSSSSGVSVGAAAGIGVGVGVGVIIIAAGVLFVFFRRKASKGQAHVLPGGYGSSKGTPAHSYQPAGLEGGKPAPRAELDSEQVQTTELDTRR